VQHLISASYIDQVSDEEIQDIVITANLTPRKCLGFKTPLGKDCKSGSHSPVALGSRIQQALLLPLHGARRRSRHPATGLSLSIPLLAALLGGLSGN
jgi:hypothetical protein